MRTAKTVWTKKNVESMYTHELISFYNKTVEIIEGYIKYDMEVPTTTNKRLQLMQAELTNRGEI